MAKSKGGPVPAPAPEGGTGAGAKEPEKGKETSLKVDVEDGQLVGKVASLRGVSVKKLFQQKDVQDFFTHLLLEEMRLEAERLKKRRS